MISRRLWRREEISRRAEKQRRGRRRELDLPTEERRREEEEEEEELVGRRRAREEGKGARVGRVSFRFSRLGTLWGVEGGGGGGEGGRREACPMNVRSVLPATLSLPHLFAD